MILTVTILSLGVLLIPRILTLPDRPRGEVRGSLKALWWVNQLYCSFFHRLRLSGRAKLPLTGPALLISNHTGGADSLLLQAGCDRVLGFMITKEWYDHWLCGWFCRRLGCIPVKRDGPVILATRDAIRALQKGRVVTIFPEGHIVPTSGRQLAEGRPGAAYLALQTGVPVFPAYIRGTTPSCSIWRGIWTPSQSQVWFGDPLDLSPYKGKNGQRGQLDQATQAMMDAIDQLRHLAWAEEGGPPNDGLYVFSNGELD